MKVLFVASECTPLAKVGGLADVVGSLPKTLKKLGVDVSIILPFYEIIPRNDKKLKLIFKDLSVRFGGKIKKFSLWQTLIPGSKVPVFFIDNKEYFSGKGMYTGNNAARFLFFSVAIIKVIKMMKFKIIHCHDWHVALVPFLIKREKIKNVSTLLTIHNLGYQEVYPANIVNKFIDTKFQGYVNPFRLGITNADLITTVSPTYAKEILTPEYGFDLEKDLKKRKKNIYGIINGLDTDYWNPLNDIYLKSRYDSGNIKKRIKNKLYLQKKIFKKESADTPILGMVSRLDDQKGFDLIKNIFLLLMKENLQFIILGKGKLEYQNFFKEMAKRYSQKFASKIGFNEELAHQIYGGCDIFLMPSIFEPCGLGQLIAMRYGAVPLTRTTGGLRDTIKPFKKIGNEIAGTGFLFNKCQSQELLNLIKKALGVYQNKKIWYQIQKNGMNQDFSWEKSAQEYLRLYQKIL